MDLVVYLDADWDVPGQRNRQHFLIPELARRMQGEGRVLAVERPICLLDGPLRRPRRTLAWLRGKRGLRQAGPNLHLVTPFVLAHNLIAARVPGLTAVNRRLLGGQLRPVLRDLGFRRDELAAWVHHPYQSEDMGVVAERWLVYDCYDDYMAGCGPFSRPDLHAREMCILARADLVLVASAELLKSKERAGAQVRLAPNGVDYEHFARVARPGPGGGEQRSNPVLGFVGKITPRLDYELLAWLAASRPEWTFVLVGPQERAQQLSRQAAYREFSSATNVQMIGPVPYDGLPVRMRAFDVCLLPYAATDPFNVSSSPLKLYEYLATGKPVVSTDLPSAREFDGLIRIGRSAEEFGQQVLAALGEGGEEHQRRLSMARANSWERRAEQVRGWLSQMVQTDGVDKCVNGAGSRL